MSRMMYVSEEVLWNDYCFLVRNTSLCREHITKGMVYSMEMNIPHSYQTIPPWSNITLYRAI